jgi:hypothetical protein
MGIPLGHSSRVEPTFIWINARGPDQTEALTIQRRNIWNLYGSRVRSPLAFIWRDHDVCCAAKQSHRNTVFQENGVASMLDVLMIVAGIGFFAVAILYTIACDRV